MRTIGIRASAKEVIYAIYDTDKASILNIEELIVPSAFYFPDALKYIRNNLLDILREYEIENAGIRITEPTSMTQSIPRIQIEGVIQEAFASSNLRRYFAGSIATISSKLRLPKADFKKYVDGTLELELDGWQEMGKNTREAILAALGAENA